MNDGHEKDRYAVRRLPERSTRDTGVVEAILDEGLVSHTTYVMDGLPVVIPTLYARRGRSILLHGSNSMGIARAVRAGSPLSVAVTLIDGIVVAKSAFHSSANYRSVVIHGTGRLLDHDEKTRALDCIVDTVLPGRRADLRPSTRSEIRQTAVIELGLDTAWAKVRSGGPSDDPADLDAPVWAGVIPLRLHAGSPVDNGDGIPVPDYVAEFEPRRLVDGNRPSAPKDTGGHP